MVLTEEEKKKIKEEERRRLEEEELREKTREELGTSFVGGMVKDIGGGKGCLALFILGVGFVIPVLLGALGGEEGGIVSGIGIGVVGTFAMILYFLPSIIAFFAREKKNRVAIFALNLFFGWTLLGWVIALVWALTED